VNAIRLRLLNNVPNNAFVRVPDVWKLAGYTPSSGGFEQQPVYWNGDIFLSEVELLERGIALFRVQIDKHTVRDYSINPNADTTQAFPKGRWS